MIEPHHSLSKTRQCGILRLPRSSYYYQPRPVDDAELTLLRLMDEQYLKTPQYGARSYVTWFERQGIEVGRKKAASMMKTLGIVSIAPKPKTSIPGKQHKVYPYLLRDKVVNQPNQVWASDVTYVPLEKGFAYLVVIMDWRTRKLKFPAFPYATIRNNALIKEFCSGLPGLGQKVTKSLSSAA